MSVYVLQLIGGFGGIGIGMIIISIFFWLRGKKKMYVNSSEFIHKVATTRRANLTLDRSAGKMNLQIANADGEIVESFTTPKVGKLTSEQYDDLSGDVIGIVQTINVHFSNITVIYVE